MRLVKLAAGAGQRGALPAGGLHHFCARWPVHCQWGSHLALQRSHPGRAVQPAQGAPGPQVGMGASCLGLVCADTGCCSCGAA